MKGLKVSLVVSVLLFSAHTQGMKLDIVKKSTSIAHESIDQAEKESMSAESGLKNTISESTIDEDGFDTIKSTKPSNRKAASKSTYSKKSISKVQKLEDDFESTPVKKKEALPESDSITTEEAVRKIDSEIANEFSDEIGMVDVTQLEDVELEY